MCISAWGERRQGPWVEHVVGHPRAARYFRDQFDRAWREKLRAWAAQWTFSMWNAWGLSLAPTVDLIQNIGFGEEATHTTAADARFMRPAGELLWPLRHPADLTPNLEAEAQWSALIASTVMSREWRAGSQKVYSALPGDVQALVRSCTPTWLRQGIWRYWDRHQTVRRARARAEMRAGVQADNPAR